MTKNEALIQYLGWGYPIFSFQSQQCRHFFLHGTDGDLIILHSVISFSQTNGRKVVGILSLFLIQWYDEWHSIFLDSTAKFRHAP